MKSVSTRKRLPADLTDRGSVMAAMPGADRSPTPAEDAPRQPTPVVRGGGYAAVTAARAQARRRGERGPQQNPTKQLVSVRYSPEVLAYFKATGSGWQTRMNEALQEWVAGRVSASKPR